MGNNLIDNNYSRKDNEPPLAIEKWGWRYHHIGIPTTKPIKGEIYIPHLKFFVSGFETSPFGIQWMRFDDDSPFDVLIKTVPHVAFEVDDLDFELKRCDFKILAKPNSPAEGLRVAIVEHNGAPIELMEFKINK